MNKIQKGSDLFRKVNLAFFACGLATFAVINSVQPILPEFSKDFQISPTVASLTLSGTTVTLAVSLLIVGSLSEAWGRKPIMTFSIFSASVLSLFSAFAPDFWVMLMFRVLMGFALAGLQAIAMAYLGEEIEPANLGVAMGLYISGNSLGGMGGRIICGVLTDYFNWRVALGSIGAFSVAASFLFWYLLPPSRNFHSRSLEPGKLIKSMVRHIKDPGLLYLYGIGCLLMGGFVSLFNYIGYQLTAPPYSLSQSVLGWIFVVFIAGTVSSTLMGRLSDKYGQRKVLWIGILIMLTGACITLNANLIIKIIGITVFTFGFFGSHSIASGWVGQRATHDKAQASSLYLFCYYIGASVAGTAAGRFWTAYGWGGVIGLISILLVVTLILSFCLSTILHPKADQAFSGNSL